jgi:EAL domain-containing protein (putative c-di-GMP-specific phosphodiesterase class I)
LRIAVNVSARQVQQRDFVGFVKAVCSEMKTAPERLELEVTEHAMLDRGQGVRNLAALRSSGVRVVLDDFGTGYSSLSCLDEIPLDGVKIDQTFVAAIGSDSFKSLVVRNVISLAHALGLSVVGEGVERDEQLVQLRAMGCDQGQGYLFGPPMSGDAFAAFVATHSAKLP